MNGLTEMAVIMLKWEGYKDIGTDKYIAFNKNVILSLLLYLKIRKKRLHHMYWYMLNFQYTVYPYIFTIFFSRDEV